VTVLAGEAVVLLALAAALAWPVPVALASARWAVRVPGAAVLLWQAIGLAAGLALLTAELTVAAAGHAGAWPAAVLGTVRDLASGRPDRLGPPGAAGAVALAATAAWLLGTLGGSARTAARERRRHRLLVDVLAEPAPPPGGEPPGAGPWPDEPPGERPGVRLRILPHGAAAAYTVPGRHSRIVLSRGAWDGLSGPQRRAVIAHERAHLRQHHDLLLTPFVAWRRSFPFLPGPAVAPGAVRTLTEFLADDVASVATGPDAVAGGLRALGAGPPVRAARLRRPGGPQWIAGVVVLAAVALLAVPPLALLLTG
jgi:hypothetical protein